ncbi:ferritin family protein [Oryzomonas japonica]|uniref:Ferritin n=2 Tax=Oryzomonas TaxID=2855184 RepID=A0A5A9XFT0_9BACT|nr:MULTISPECIES: ferritin family protein [Oryzomonas]KAA0892017.1 ferritin [Oryzomonas rubra]KAB0665150.1 ferritin family protein [Oryzomonas japonica]
MGREFSLQEALKLAIKAEKDSMDFYRKAASVAKNERARKVFDLLANEEVGHLKAFFAHYKGEEFGDLTSYINSPADTKNPTYMKLEKAINEEMVEQKALELALAEEKECIGQYSQFAKDMVDPGVRSVFERVVKETQGHYDLIESEYAHVMKMVHESDQDIYVRE